MSHLSLTWWTWTFCMILKRSWSTMKNTNNNNEVEVLSFSLTEEEMKKAKKLHLICFLCRLYFEEVRSNGTKMHGTNHAYVCVCAPYFEWDWYILILFVVMLLFLLLLLLLLLILLIVDTNVCVRVCYHTNKRCVQCTVELQLQCWLFGFPERVTLQSFPNAHYNLIYARTHNREKTEKVAAACSFLNVWRGF